MALPGGEVLSRGRRIGANWQEAAQAQKLGAGEVTGNQGLHTRQRAGRGEGCLAKTRSCPAGAGSR